jgi:hypothetical protein
MCVKPVVTSVYVEVSRLEMMAILVHAKTVIHTNKYSQFRFSLIYQQ